LARTGLGAHGTWRARALRARAARRPCAAGTPAGRIGAGAAARFHLPLTGAPAVHTLSLNRTFGVRSAAARPLRRRRRDISFKESLLMATTHVSDSSFEDDVIKSTTPVVVDFWAEWCGPCKQIGPSLEELSTEMAGKVRIVKVNVDDNPNSAAKYGVRGIPTLLMFKDGEVVSNVTGARPKTALKSWIEGSL
jgi:thioredoxin 1